MEETKLQSRSVGCYPFKDEYLGVHKGLEAVSLALLLDAIIKLHPLQFLSKAAIPLSPGIIVLHTTNDGIGDLALPAEGVGIRLA